MRVRSVPAASPVRSEQMSNEGRTKSPEMWRWGGRDHPWKLMRAGPVSIESFIPQAMAVSFFFENRIPIPTE